MLHNETPAPRCRSAVGQEAGRETSVERIANYILAHGGAVLQVVKFGRTVTVGKIVEVAAWRRLALVLPYGRGRALPATPSVPLVAVAVAAHAGVDTIIAWKQRTDWRGALRLDEALRVGTCRPEGGVREVFIPWRAFQPAPRGIRWPYLENPVIEVSDSLLDDLVASATEASATEAAGEVREVRG